ncbi:recombinase family protein [Bacillus altitudinis]|nr:recombinase family protein [Bacillus altitudinis]
MMRDTLQDSEIDYIIVLVDDRFARNHADAVNMVDRLKKHGKNLICVADGINTENERDLEYFRMKSIFSERHRMAIKFSCKYGLHQRVKNGLYHGRKVTEYTSINKRLVVQEEQANIVRIIFEKCAYDNWGFWKIADI